MELRQEPHWSYSALNTYLACSLKFAFQYIYKAETERTASSLPFGRTFHIAATHYTRSIMQGKAAALPEVHEVFAEWFKAECAACTKLTFKNGEDSNSLIEQAKFMLNALLANWKDYGNIVDVAHAFKVNVPGLDKVFIGEFDLVVKEGDTPVIVDWKTAASRWPAGKADKDFQATAFSYAYLMENKSNTIPKFRFDVVTKAKNPSLENHHTQRTEDDLQRFIRMTGAIQQAVKQEVFLPSETSFSCADCQFAGACKAWHRKSAAKHISMAA
jgi:putative RecB family exonuclease